MFDFNLSESVPLLLFLIIVFMAFSFIETIIIFSIKYYMRTHWVFFVDKLMKQVTFNKTLVRVLAMGSLAVLVVFMVLFTPLFDILVGGDDIIQLMGLILILEMFIVYLAASREVAEVTIEKRIHLYVFTFFSITAYTAIMMMANRGYANYEKSLNNTFYYPIVHSIERGYEERVEDRLIEIMREDIKEGGCEYMDYATPENDGVVVFSYIKNDKGLVEAGYIQGEPAEPNAPLRGVICTHETKFMITPDGKWFQVLEQPEQENVEL